MILLKKEQPSEIHDYQPMSLIHNFGKLVARCMAQRLVPVLQWLVQPNQNTFIWGWSIHDNFKSVQLSCTTIHKARVPYVLLKIDIAKAFDSVA